MVSTNGVSSPSSDARAAETADTPSTPIANDPIHERDDMATSLPAEVLPGLFDLATARTRVVAAVPLGVGAAAADEEAHARRPRAVGQCCGRSTRACSRERSRR